MSTATAASPTVRQGWRRSRAPLAVGVIVLLVAVVVAAASAGGRRGYLDPTAYDEPGSRAVAALLEQRGVTVERVRTSQSAAAALRAADPRSTTLVVAVPALLRKDQAESVAAVAPSSVVLVSPEQDAALEAFAPGVVAAGEPSARRVEPGCAWSGAALAGSADAGVRAYRVGGSATNDVDRCYPVDGAASLVRVVDGDGRTTTVIGNAAILTNKSVGAAGNAALALNALGERAHVVWYLPSPGDTAGGRAASITDLLPRWITWAVLWLFLVVVVVAAWRGRRLGPVVTERLPAVVKASETVEGRGRLYRRARARDRAAAELRAASRRRLAVVLGLPRSTDAATLVAAIGRRSTATGPVVQDLLFGDVPPDDAALVGLADALDALEREVRRP